jgi:hypothetical protein
MRAVVWRGMAVALCLGLSTSDATADQPPPREPAAVQLATFVADITPPLGEIVCCGIGADSLQRDAVARFIEDPVLAKGIVLKDAGGVYVLCAFDWCGICNDAHDAVRKRLAAAAGTTPARVAVHALHQHTSPGADTGAQRILDGAPGGVKTIGVAHFEKATNDVAAAVRDAMRRLRPVTHVGTGAAPADRLASSRRIRLPDGTIGTRLSMGATNLNNRTKDPLAQLWPEGKIDGFLRTITFYNGDQPLAALHYYATHPQSHHRDGRVTYDVPGLAREWLQKETGVFQVYFTGCGGDVAMGKYNDGAPANRPVLAERMYDAMTRSSKSIKERHPVTPIGWRAESLRLEPRRAPEFSESVCQKVLQDPETKPVDRIKAAMTLAFLERVKAGHTFDLNCLTIGPVAILHLPGEMFVEYQLFAQRAAPAGTFVAVAAYGDCATWYVGDNQAYRDRGGYEQTWSFIEPSEGALKKAIAKLVNP